MVTKNKAYKRKLDVADRLLKKNNIDESKRKLVYSIMEGSYRNGTGRGSRTYGEQRVDSYEGRIEAVKDILGLNSSKEYSLLEKVISSNEYLHKTRSKSGELRSEVVGSYVRGLYLGAEAVEGSLKPQIKVLKKDFVYTSGKILNSKVRRTIAAAASLVLLAGAGVGIGCHKEEKVSESKYVVPVTKTVEIKEVSQKVSSFSASVLYPKLRSPKDSLCYTRIKKSVSSNLDGGVTPEQLRNFYDSNPLVMPEDSEPSDSEDVFAEPAPAEVVYSNAEKVSDAQVKPVGTNGLYRMHVDFRNLQSRDRDGDSLDDKVSASPVYLGRALKNEVVSFGEGVVDGKDLGYTNGKTSSRLKSIKDALKLGFTKENKEARKQYNPLLKTIMAAYDGVQSIAKGAVDGTDLVLGGLAEKVVYDVIGGGVKTLVNSTVDTGNFAFAVPLDASQRFENWAFKNKGKVSMETYELASTVMRFGGNVVLHEAPFDGKFVEVRNEAGEKVLINKGQTGATLESLMAILLDAGILSQIHSGGDGGNSNGGSWSWNSSGSPGGDVGSFGSSGSGGGI